MRKLRLRVATIISFLFIAITGVNVATAATASAGHGDPPKPKVTATDGVAPLTTTLCPIGKFCTYWNGGFGDPMYYYSPQLTAHCYEIGYPWDNQTSGVSNNTVYEVWVFYLHGCVGNALTIGSHKQVDWAGTPNNDTISSIYITNNP